VQADLFFHLSKMSKTDHCIECNFNAENYKQDLENETRALISFRGHGTTSCKQYFFDLHFSRPFKFEHLTNGDLKTLIKLILFGSTKLHFIQNQEPLDVPNGGKRIASI